jgi:multidrug efflux pump subunit AcrB
VTLTGYSLDHARLTALLAVLLAVSGILLFLNFPSREDPKITVREAVVSAYYPGMAAERVEQLITRKLEERILKIPQVENVWSTSRTGSARIHVEVKDRFSDLEPVWQDLRNKMRDLASELPEGTIGPRVNDEFGDVFVAVLALRARGFSLAEMRDAARDIRDALTVLPGVKKVDLHAVQEERIFLEVSNARLAELGLDPTQLIGTLQEQNVILTGGRVDIGDQRIALEPSGDFSDIDDIRGLVFEVPGAEQFVYLVDILSLRRAYEDPPQALMYYNGERAIGIAISMMDGYNILEFTPRLRERIDIIEQRLPLGMHLEFATEQAEFVDTAVTQVTSNVYQALAIVSVVAILFLGWRAGLIVGLHVPLTILASLTVMYVIGIPLHRASLGTLIISLGILVDSGIVIAEDVRRRMDAGEQPHEAAVAAGRELTLPLLTSAATTILAFAPLALTEHVSGEYLRSMPKVITITLIASWILAIAITPLLGYRFIRPTGTAKKRSGAGERNRVADIYRRSLEIVMRARLAFAVLLIVSVAGAGYLMQQIPRQFFPPSDRAQFMIMVDLPAGYDIEATDHAVRPVLDWLGDASANPEVERHSAFIGYGGPRFFLSLSPRDPAPNRALVVVDVEHSGQVDALLDRSRRYLIENHPLIQARVKPFWLGPTETGLMEIRLSGPDADTLFDFSNRIETALREIPGIVGLYNNWENRVVKLAVNIDQARARRAGVTSADAAASLERFFSGLETTVYREGDTLIPVLLRGTPGERHSMDRVRTLNVYSSERRTDVPLFQIADFKLVNTFSRIDRRNLKRTVTIAAKHGDKRAAALQQEILPALRELERELPTGYEWEFGGETEKSTEAQNALYHYLPHAVVLMGLLLVWQFNSYRNTLVVFATIPLAFIGSVLGLYVGGSHFGFMALLGFLSLMGIVINIAIVMLSRIEQQVTEGDDAYEAVLKACEQRFRPILMTTLTTVLGLSPMLFPPDPLYFTMALVIASGLALGTFILLYAVPLLYTVLFRIPIARADSRS